MPKPPPPIVKAVRVMVLLDRLAAPTSVAVELADSRFREFLGRIGASLEILDAVTPAGKERAQELLGILVPPLPGLAVVETATGHVLASEGLPLKVDKLIAAVKAVVRAD